MRHSREETSISTVIQKDAGELREALHDLLAAHFDGERIWLPLHDWQRVRRIARIIACRLPRNTARSLRELAHLVLERAIRDVHAQGTSPEAG
jgi:hypothetical protein